MKKLFSVFIALTIVLTSFTALASPREIKVVVNNTPIEFDVSPVNYDGRILVPLRAVFEELGAHVTWDQSTKTASVTYESNTLKITVDSQRLVLNNKTLSQKLDVPAKSIDGRVLIPLRYACEALGFSVTWSQSEQTARVTGKGIASSNPGISAENIYRSIGTNKADIQEYFSSSSELIYSLKSSLNNLNSAWRKTDVIYSVGFLLTDCVNIASSVSSAVGEGADALYDELISAGRDMASSLSSPSEDFDIYAFFSSAADSAYYMYFDAQSLLLDLHMSRYEKGYFTYSEAVAYNIAYYITLTEAATIQAATELMLEKSPQNVTDAVLLTGKQFVSGIFSDALAYRDYVAALNSDAVFSWQVKLNRYKDALEKALS